LPFPLFLIDFFLPLVLFPFFFIFVLSLFFDSCGFHLIISSLPQLALLGTKRLVVVIVVI
jgi:hypothetical protein